MLVKGAEGGWCKFILQFIRPRRSVAVAMIILLTEINEDQTIDTHSHSLFMWDVFTQPCLTFRDELTNPPSELDMNV